MPYCDGGGYSTNGYVEFTSYEVRTKNVGSTIKYLIKLTIIQNVFWKKLKGK